jgi:putative ABC transport system permease protein
MVPIARRNLLSDRLRLAIAVGGVAFAVFLIVVVLSLYDGFRASEGEFTADFPADLWVVQEGTADLFRSTSLIEGGLREDVAAEPGVAQVVGAVGRNTRVELNGSPERIFVFALEEGPAATDAFASMGYDSPPGPGEIIANDMVAAEGDTIKLGGRTLDVVGTYGGGTPFGPYSFVNYADAASFASPGYVNYFVVFLADPSTAGAVGSSIEASHPELEALTGDRLAEYIGEEIDSFLPVITVVLVIAFIVGTAVVSLIIYTATVEKARDYAILKALGASNGRLYRMVLTQSFIVGGLGFIVGVPLAVLVTSYVDDFVPEFLTRLEWRSMAMVLVAVFVMSFVAAYLPTRRVSAVDPATVFRA